MAKNETNITAKLIQASECAITGTEIFTMELEYPRTIHAQLMTHRVFSKNSSSSRAIPFQKALQHIEDNPTYPMWSENQAGMQGVLVEDTNDINFLNTAHNTMLKMVSSVCKSLSEENNIHKQNINRYLEPFSTIKIVLTTTEWDNWDWLRDDEEAQHEIGVLARKMREVRDNARANNEVLELQEGEWHVPYITRHLQEEGFIRYFTLDGEEVTPEEAVKISTSCCAQISYRNLNSSKEKAMNIYEKLFNGRKVHASPSEHQATPIGFKLHTWGDEDGVYVRTGNWPEGITHMDRDAIPWSGNFRNWIQNRQLLPNHDKAKF